MNKNIETLKEACKREGLVYQDYHASGNLFSVVINGKRFVFANWTTPVTPQSIRLLCADKDYFYSVFQDIIQMPKTRSFFNPYSDEKYSKYLAEKTIYEIIDAVETKFTYPLIIKKNKGSWGSNVFKVNNRRELEKSILTVYDARSSKFDFVCLAQEFIEIDVEFRIVYLDGKYQFGYEKITEGATFTDNLSPLHWEGSRAALVREPAMIEQIEAFCAPLFAYLQIPYCGLDIALDKNGEFWLIEANSSPGFDHIIRHEGIEPVVTMYRNMLLLLREG